MPYLNRSVRPKLLKHIVFDLNPDLRISEHFRQVHQQVVDTGKKEFAFLQYLRPKTDKGPEDIKKLVEEAGALALVGSRERGVRSEFDFSPTEDLVLADRVQIQQVIINLMRNAIEAMKDTPRRELLVRTTRNDDQLMTVEVADTGAGISEEVAGQLFQPFVTTKPGGMGIGLSISRRIIQSHGGDLTYRRNDSGGATFSFTLPIVENVTHE